jgi:hypothetical protein
VNNYFKASCLVVYLLAAHVLEMLFAFNSIKGTPSVSIPAL